MARATAAVAFEQRIGNELDAAFAEWRDVRNDLTEWDDWDADSRLLYGLEWGIAEDRLLRLYKWAVSDRLTPAQRTRYEQLLQLVEQTRPILQEMGIR